MSVKFDFASLGQPFEREWPVTVSEPQDGGGVQEQAFTARFKLVDKSFIDDLVAKASGDVELDLLSEGFVGLGKDYPDLTPELKALMIGRPFVRAGLFRAFMNFQRGVAAKN